MTPAESAAPHVLTLDISSSGVRARAHDRALTTVAESAVDLPSVSGPDGTSAHRFADIRDAVVRTVRAVTATAGVRVGAIAASGTASSFAWARRDEDGRVTQVSDALLWSDTRSASAWPEIAEAVTDAYERTLCPPDISYWPAKLRWAVGSVASPASLMFGSGKDFIFEWLTGQLWTDPMSAGSTGVLDSTSSAGASASLASASGAPWSWDGPLLSLVGVSAAQLPALHEATEWLPLLPAVAEQLGLGADVVRVAAGGMDGPITQFGAAGFEPGIASCTVGTSIAFRANSAVRVADPERRVWCYPVDRSHWVVGGAGNNGGNVITWMRDQLGSGAELGALVGAGFDTEPDPALLFVPYLTGERAPLWRPELRAAFVGLAAHHTLADLTRAAVDGVAGALLELSAAVESAAGAQGAVRFTGGFTQESRWVQLMTDALGVDSALPEPLSATATGVAILAWATALDAPIESVFSPGESDRVQPDGAETTRIAGVAERMRAVRAALWPV